MGFLHNMEEILMVKLPLKLQNKPAENMQRRKLDPALRHYKHDERASAAFMKTCTFSVRTASNSVPGF